MRRWKHRTRRIVWAVGLSSSPRPPEAELRLAFCVHLVGQRIYESLPVQATIARATAKCYNQIGMDKTIRKYSGATAFEEAKADEYRYWQSRPAQERLEAIAETTLMQYAMKGEVQGVPRLQRTLVHLQRPQH